MRTSRFLGSCGLLGLGDHGDSLRSLVACGSGRGLVARGLVARRCAALHFSRVHPQHKQQLHGQPPSASSPRSTLDIPLDHGAAGGQAFLRGDQVGGARVARSPVERLLAALRLPHPSRGGQGLVAKRGACSHRFERQHAGAAESGWQQRTSPTPVCGAPLDSCGNFRACKLLIHAQHSWRDLEDDRRSVQT